MSVKIADLKKGALFALMTDQELARALPICTEEEIRHGATLFSQGSPGSDFFIIKEGQIVSESILPSRTSDATRQTVIRTFDPGEMVGWSCITFEDYYSSGVAGRDSSLIRIDSKKLRGILDTYPRMGYKFMTALSDNLTIQMRFMQDALMKERSLVIEEVHKRTAS